MCSSVVSLEVLCLLTYCAKIDDFLSNIFGDVKQFFALLVTLTCCLQIIKCNPDPCLLLGQFLRQERIIFYELSTAGVACLLLIVKWSTFWLSLIVALVQFWPGIFVWCRVTMAVSCSRHVWRQGKASGGILASCWLARTAGNQEDSQSASVFVY